MRNNDIYGGNFMRLINWFWVATALFAIGIFAGILGAVGTGVVSVVSSIASVLLAIAGWIVYSIALRIQ